MNGFFIDKTALTLLAFFLFILWFLENLALKFMTPSLKFPSFDLFPKAETKSFRLKFLKLPKILFYLSLFFFSLSFLDLHYFTLKEGVILPEDQEPPVQGIAIYLLADESGSMLEPVKAQLDNGRYQELSKIDFLKNVTVPFVKERPKDLIGLVSFARSADIKAPLTLDHETILNHIELLAPSEKETEGGTAIGYAIFKTVNLIIATKHFAEDQLKKSKPSYEIKNAIIILVTDGVQNVNPEDIHDRFRSMDLKESSDYAKENGVKLYIINIDPKILQNKFSAERNLMKKVTESTGGNFYVVDSERSLSEIYHEIDQIEKFQIQDLNKKDSDRRSLYERHSMYPYFIGIGLLFLTLGLILENTLFRKVP